MIHFTVPGIPPTSNHAYFDKVMKKGGKFVPIRILTKEGKAYKTEVKTYLAKNYQDVLRFLQPNKPISMIVRMFIYGIETKGFSEGKAENRYKKLDASNRLKLFEDALVSACNYDDSQHFRMLLIKEPAQTEEEQRVQVWAWCWEDDRCYFDDVFHFLGTT